MRPLSSYQTLLYSTWHFPLPLTFTSHKLQQAAFTFLPQLLPATTPTEALWRLYSCSTSCHQPSQTPQKSNDLLLRAILYYLLRGSFAYMTTVCVRLHNFFSMPVPFLASHDSAAIVSAAHTLYFHINPRIPSKKGGGVIVTVIPQDP